jgi:hypothetical protein
MAATPNGPDVALAHDRQPGRPVPAAAEPVGGVGQPVQVQTTGQHLHSQNAQHPGQQWYVWS